MNNVSETCGYKDMMKQTNTFPPIGPIAVPEILEVMQGGTSSSYLNNSDCNLFYQIETCKYMVALRNVGMFH